MAHSLKRYMLGLITLFAFTPLAHAQVVENDLRLVADQAGAPPNVMILFDTSGSMRNVIWHEDFNPKVGYEYANDANCNTIGLDIQPGTDNQCPGSGLPNDACPDNDNFEYSGTTFRCSKSYFPSECAGWNFTDPAFNGEDCFTTSSRIYFTIPEVNNNEAWWSENYLNFLVQQMHLNGAIPTDLPNERRTDGGKRVIQELVDSINPDYGSQPGYDEQVRFGIARLDGGNVGGYVIQEIQDGNKTAVINSLLNLPASGGTPVSEAFVDVGRYFVGELDTLGSYSQYDRRMSDGAIDPAAAPLSPMDPGVLCRGNFAIIISDGEPTSDDHSHALTEFLNTFTDNYDNDADATLEPGALDDVAAYLFEQDLIDDTVMPGKQNIITYTIGFALDSQLLADTAENGDGEYFPVSTTDQLADTLKLAVEEIILRNATFTAATVPASRSVFGDGFFTAFFEPRPKGELYRGHLQAYRIDENFDIVGTDGLNALNPATGQFLEPRDTYFWDAGEVLLDPLLVRRLLYTPADPTTDSFDFTAANLTAADLAITGADVPTPPLPPLYTNSLATTPEALADEIVSYVSGKDPFDEDADGVRTETREWILGDIFHSNPQQVDQPPLLLAAEDGFGPVGDPNSFLGTFSLRDKVLYAGANDGMLHAFDAGSFVNGDNPVTPNTTENGYYTLGTGAEIFGYVPRFLLDDLKRMPLTGAKPYYVDGQIAISDIWLPSSGNDVDKTADEWSTAMVVGMRNGDRGYLALDVTDPTATQPTDLHGPYPKFMWEFFDPSEPLGRTWSKPVITRVKLKSGLTQDYCGAQDGDGADTLAPLGNCRERWVAIFGGGYLEQGDPNITDQFLTDPTDPAWEDASKAIFVVAMDTGQVLARASYDPTDSELQNMTFSLPSEPAVLDLDFDGFADVIYIGDTGGQVWKWDISAVGQVSGATGVVPLTTWPVGRFFTAPVASNGHRRSFFYSPAASLVNGELRIAFGSGERTNLEYTSSAGIDENHYYVVTDPTPTGAGSFTNLPYDISDVTSLTSQLEDPDTTDQGFYLTAGPDEKFVSDSLVFAGFIITASYTPDLSPATSGGECEATGDATLYIFSIGDGSGFFDGSGNPDESRRLVVGSGLPTSPSITIVSGNETKVVLQTSDGRVIKLDGPPSDIQPVEPVYWRQSF